MKVCLQIFRSVQYFERTSEYQFGKQLQAEIIPGWSEYYLDYKFLKKIVSSLAAKRPASEAASLALGIRPGDAVAQAPTFDIHSLDRTPEAQVEPSILQTYGKEDDRGPDFQAHKAAFFFKLERELEKVCGIIMDMGSTSLIHACVDQCILSTKGSRA